MGLGKKFVPVSEEPNNRGKENVCTMSSEAEMRAELGPDWGDYALDIFERTPLVGADFGAFEEFLEEYEAALWGQERTLEEECCEVLCVPCGKPIDSDYDVDFGCVGGGIHRRCD